MATGYGVPVRFTKEKNVWDIFGLFNVGSGGALNFATVPTSAGPQFVNKGIANVWQNTPTFTGVTSSGSATITSVSSFAGIFTGMALLSSGNIPAGVTVGTVSASTGSIVMNGGNASGFTGSTGATMVVSGGQYIIQFGVNTSIGSISNQSRLDTYNRLLDFNVSWDSSVSSSIGTATQAPLAPNVYDYFIVANNTTVKTVPPTAATASTDAAIIVQFGNNIGPAFIPGVPSPGLAMKSDFTFGNTTAP